jgi:hypothetical protein
VPWVAWWRVAFSDAATDVGVYGFHVPDILGYQNQGDAASRLRLSTVLCGIATVQPGSAAGQADRALS